MPRQARISSKTGIYHIIQRGINREALFRADQDFRKYLQLLNRYNAEGGYEILAYCMMVNHVHLLINFHDDPPGLFVKKLSVSYSSFFNKKYKRTGHLFQDRFKSFPVEDERYLLTLVKYIHNNPEKAGICSADQYMWSSYGEYLHDEETISTALLFAVIGGRDAYIKSLNEPDPSLDSEYENVRKSDSDALAIVQSVIQCPDARVLKTLGREYRDILIEEIISKGVSATQLSRLTGISYSTLKRRSRKKRSSENISDESW